MNARRASLIAVVWDWNGTLRNDVADHLAALNATLPALGHRPITLDTYRAVHRMPIRGMYDELLGRTLSDEEWLATDADFLTELGRRPVRLQDGAHHLMLRLGARGIRQSLLSLTPHQRLVEEVEQAGIAGLLARHDGRHGPAVRTKAPALAAHLAALGNTVAPSRTIVIGDSVDDAVAARSVGAVPVLFTGGLHGAARLAADGAPLADTLEDAVTAGLAVITGQQLATA
ncbi:HAD family hydrolase [Kitasatospora sp. NPDC047058]|uniref:HAD family hydrolase n=1 Tax=Kitasatospora sp. NPDC047058 TaxID=3155620 RepID=UPI0033C2C57C